MAIVTVYATPAELAAYIAPGVDPVPNPPANAAVLLRKASRLVRRTISAQYRTYPDTGLPVDPYLAEAIKEATCEQAAAWSVNGIDPGKGAAGLKPVVTTKSLNGAATSYGQSADIQEAVVNLAKAEDLTTEAWEILNDAGLISNRVTTGARGYRRPWSTTPEGSLGLGEGTLGT